MARKPFRPRSDHPRCPVTGKLKYKSMRSAENAMREALLYGGRSQVPCRVYLCDHHGCGGWHLTSAARLRPY